VDSGATDIFTEPAGDPDTLANLGPLRPLAGVWHGTTGHDTHPVAAGSEDDTFVERFEAQPIDFQTNGPQLLYGLRYHTHIVKPGEVAMFHDQVGYWLWEPATHTVTLTASIPRGQTLLASGLCDSQATRFELAATRGSTLSGIASNPFLDEHFTTTHFRIVVEINTDGTWAYEEHTTLLITGRPEPFDHVDRHTLHRVGLPTANPLAVEAQRAAVSSPAIPPGEPGS